MKYFFSIIIFVFLGSVALAQDSIEPMDQSQMDMAYFPPKYPILSIQNKAVSPLIMRVIYSRPHQNGRQIFGGLQPFGDIWRLGANEATEIQFFRDVIINNKKIPKGRYTMYAIVFPEKWTIIINRQTDIWGAFVYDKSKDIVRIDVPVTAHSLIENMTIQFTRQPSGANMNVYWENVKVTMPILF